MRGVGETSLLPRRRGVRGSERDVRVIDQLARSAESTSAAQRRLLRRTPGACTLAPVSPAWATALGIDGRSRWRRHPSVSMAGDELRWLDARRGSRDRAAGATPRAPEARTLLILLAGDCARLRHNT